MVRLEGSVRRNSSQGLFLELLQFTWLLTWGGTVARAWSSPWGLSCEERHTACYPKTKAQGGWTVKRRIEELLDVKESSISFFQHHTISWNWPRISVPICVILDKLFNLSKSLWFCLWSGGDGSIHHKPVRVKWARKNLEHHTGPMVSTIKRKLGAPVKSTGEDPLLLMGKPRWDLRWELRSHTPCDVANTKLLLILKSKNMLNFLGNGNMLSLDWKVIARVFKNEKKKSLSCTLQTCTFYYM